MLPSPRSGTLFPYTTLFRSILLRLSQLVTAARPIIQPHDRCDRYGRYPGELASALAAGKVFQQGLVKLHARIQWRSEEHTSELQSRLHSVCRLPLDQKNSIS